MFPSWMVSVFRNIITMNMIMSRRPRSITHTHVDTSGSMMTSSNGNISALLAFWTGIHWSPVNSPHKVQWRGTLIFLFDLRLNKRLNKQSWGWWFETPSPSLWRHRNVPCQSINLFKYLSASLFDFSEVGNESRASKYNSFEGFKLIYFLEFKQHHMEYFTMRRSRIHSFSVCSKNTIKCMKSGQNVGSIM